MIFKVEEHVQINQGEVIYSKDDLSFDFEPIQNSDCTLLIGYINLTFDSETKLACQVWGYNDINTWISRELVKPNSIKGRLYLEDGIDAGENIRLIDAGVWTTYFDKNSGWVCIGNDKIEDNDFSVEFAKNTIAVTNQNRLKALWLKPYFIQ
ncbi:hypothetical protein [Oceanirhabdus sp. W0125-5]|uniref:hypothetical protein n=1 Tax=Oceanirhabdus sp. W0125-5 TaxID=2999116 RepID=UPI0022F2C59D|nr:hypothetical protein [Oceanirhabdus sp. W0125-5]WBW98147.1 hypothetical protein OW730_05110 [Oceanirhabdus sp. W0125-5]